MWCSFALLPDWSVFLTGLGYKQGNKKHDTVFKKFEDVMTAPAKLASVWAEGVSVEKRKDWLEKRGIDDDDDQTNIISGIMDLAPKGLLLPVYYPILCLF
jgi:hypothetical protein